MPGDPRAASRCRRAWVIGFVAAAGKLTRAAYLYWAAKVHTGFARRLGDVRAVERWEREQEVLQEVPPGAVPGGLAGRVGSEAEERALLVRERVEVAVFEVPQGAESTGDNRKPSPD